MRQLIQSLSMLLLITLASAAGAVSDDVLTASGDSIAQKIDDVQVVVGNDDLLTLSDIGVAGTFKGQQFPLPMHLKQVNWDCEGDWFYEDGQCNLLVIEETQALRDQEYQCPDGYTLNGDNCYKLVTYTKAANGGPFSYHDCDPGYTLSGTDCEADNQVAATYNEVWTCSPGWTLSGTTCYRTLTEPAVDNGYYSCIAGYTLSGDTCYKNESKAADYVEVWTCSSGWTLSGTTCNRTLTEPAVDNGYYSCSTGYILSGDTCFKNESVAAAYIDVWTCSSGWTLSGTTCNRTLTEPAVDNGYYSCSTGYTLSGDTCTKNESKAAVYNEVWTCSSGWTLSGSTCNRTLTEPADWISVYECQSGYTLSGTTCSKSESQAATATTTYSCPSGYTLSGTTCSRNVTETINATATTTYTCATASYSAGHYQWYHNNQGNKVMKTSYTRATRSGSTCNTTYRWKDTGRDVWTVSYGYPANGSTSYSCPSGYTRSGTKCNRTVTESISATATTTYSCDTGWSLSDTTCSRTLSEPAVDNGYYSCTTGYSLNGSTCSKYEETAATDEGYYSCDSGWTLSGSSCSRTLTQAASWNPVYECSAGYSLSGTTCSKYEETAATDEGYYSCDSGWTLSGSTCSRTLTQAASWNPVYECSAGYSLSGTTCSKYEETTANDEGYYSCDSGWTLSGSSCSRTLTQLASWNSVYECSAGYSLSGTTCSKYEETTATDESYFSCASGFVLDVDKCLYSATINAELVDEYTCGSGYTLSGTDCLKVEVQPAQATYSCQWPYPIDTGTQCRLDSVAPVDGACPDPAFPHYLYSGQSQYLCYSALFDSADSTTQFVSYTVTYSCTSGWTVNGSLCERTLVEAATHTYGYQCPSDNWTLNGTTCSMLQPQSLVADHLVGEDYSCDPGWDLNVDTCSQQEYLTEAITLSLSDWYCEGEGSVVNTDQCRQSWIKTRPAIAVSWTLQADYKLITDETLQTAMVAAYLDGNSFTISVVEGDKVTYTEELSYTGIIAAGVTSNGSVGVAGSTPGTVYMPAIAEEVFTRSNGHQVVLVNEMLNVNAARLSGIHDVFARLDSSAPGAVLLNGVLLAPGAMAQVSTDKDFDADPEIDYRMAIASAESGDYGLTLTTSASDTRPVRYHVAVWQPAVTESLSNSTPVQVLDTVSLSVEKASRCRLTQEAASAINASPINDPICLVEWATIPSGLVEQSLTGITSRLSMEGFLNSEGAQSADYTLFMFNGEKKIAVGAGSIELNAVAPTDAVQLEVPENERSTKALIVEASIELEQVSGTICRLTTDTGAAIVAAEDRSTQGRPTCLVEWNNIPSGLAQISGESLPWLRGVADAAGTYDVRWTLSVFNQGGEKILIGNQSNVVNVLPPDDPTIELSSNFAFDDTKIILPMEYSRAGTAKIESDNADLTYEIYRDGQLVETDEVQGGWGTSNLRFYKYLQLDSGAALWSKTEMRVKVFYSRAPSISVEKSVDVYVEPASSIRPVSSLKDNETGEVLNSDVFGVETVIRNYYRQQDGYLASEMGEWEIRLVQLAGGELTPLTVWGSAINGSGLHEFDASQFDGLSSVRIVAQARLKVPAELSAYERIEETTRTLSVIILNGNPIDGAPEARKLSGKAPFTAVVRLRVDDYNLSRSLETVTWQVSEDGGVSWTDTIKDGYGMTSFTQTFPTGIYHLRARTVNINSGAEMLTGTIELNSYDTVDLSVDGPMVKFVGENASYQAQVLLNEMPATHGDDVVVEWSTDKGDSYFQSPLGDQLDIDGSVAGRTNVWVRARTMQAPADDPYAYTELKRSVEFREVKPPRVYVFGPTTAEKGMEYEYTARTSLPYAGMDSEIDGYFTLPNGDQVTGTEVTFIPDAADVEAGRREILYTSWVVGWKDQGAIRTYGRNVRVWDYLFPEFVLSYTKDAGVVPSNLNLSMRPISFSGELDSPQYEWNLPPEAEVTYAGIDYARGILINDAGTYSISVKVSDARGNEVTKSLDISLGVPEPYELHMTTTLSNELGREPVDINIRPYVSGGHPRDRIASYVYRLNGEFYSTGSQYGRYSGAMEGIYDFELEVTSQMGEVITGTSSVAVIKNTPPVCSARYRETIGSYIVYAECEDTDGRMRRYEWTYFDETRLVTSDRVTISKETDMPAFEVSVTGIDDSDARSEIITVTIDPAALALQ